MPASPQVVTVVLSSCRPADPAGRATRLNARVRSSGIERSDAMFWGDVKYTHLMRAPHHF
jgi:hypothetical protein